VMSATSLLIPKFRTRRFVPRPVETGPADITQRDDRYGGSAAALNNSIRIRRRTMPHGLP
jgi:hypothetical protein